MTKVLQIPFMIVFLILLIGCSLKNKNEQNQIIKNTNNKYCNKYKKNMYYASNYIKKEFEEGYFSKNDIVGAKAQLFLIESDSPTIFAKNINAANESYTLNYDLAKKSNCDLIEFSTTPLDRLKKSINFLEKKNDKK